MSVFLASTVARAKSCKKTIVLPESEDHRVLDAAEMILRDDVANLIIIGDENELLNGDRDLSKARIIDPSKYEGNEELAQQLFELRKHKGMTIEKARELVCDELYFGVMLVKTKAADGMVAGACHTTGDVLRPSLQILRTAPGSKLVSAFMVMCVPECDHGANGTFVFTDCGLMIRPNAEELANIAVSAANSFRLLVDEEPKVALLSHSTKGSAVNEDAEKVVQAAAIAHELAPDLVLDGELQLDAALIPEIGDFKAPGSPVAGQANVLVFPDLDAGNIGYKLLHFLGKTEAYGPITQGIAAPINDLSRGCAAEDIYGVIAITCVQAQYEHL